VDCGGLAGAWVLAELGAGHGVLAAALARHAPNLPVRVVDSGDDGAMTEVVAMDRCTDYAQRGRVFTAAVAALGAAW
jgi:UDP-N-acetylmuramoylalanine--D-glutamate ligase